MLYSSSLLAVVGSGAADAPPVTAPTAASNATLSPRRLQLINTSEDKVIADLNFSTSILNVLMSRKRLVVVLEHKIHLFDLSSLRCIRTIETDGNPLGLAALCDVTVNSGPIIGSNGVQLGAADGQPQTEACLLAYPGDLNQGNIILCDAMTGITKTIVNAHKTALVHFSFSASGTRLATASNKGTVIRVFDVLPVLHGGNYNHVCTLRRGSSNATIFSLAFNSTCTMLCCSSDKGTVHVYRIPAEASGQESSGVHIPALSNLGFFDVSATRDWAHVKLPVSSGGTSSDNRNICAFAPKQGTDNEVFVVSLSDGYIHRYSLRSNTSGNEGEMKLENSTKLL